MAASVVLNGARTSSSIAPATRDRILKAAARLRYRPNATARALANRRMNTIGVAAVIEEGVLNQYFLEVFNGVIEAASHRGQNTTVFTLHDWERDTLRLGGFCDGRIDGLILIAPLLTRAAGRSLPTHTPFVSIHGNNPLKGVVNLESDEETGAFQVVSHLVAFGHRRILHLAGHKGLLGAERRIRGYKRALAASGIPFDRSLLVEAGYTHKEGYRAFDEWLQKHAGQPLPQAVFCSNDLIALGVLERMAEAGLRAPDDVSVAGFDDTLAARTTVPQLTTVRQPLRAMGSHAVEVLLSRVARQETRKSDDEANPIVFPVELVPRSSVGTPPKAQKLAPAPRTTSG